MELPFTCVRCPTKVITSQVAASTTRIYSSVLKTSFTIFFMLLPVLPAAIPVKSVPGARS